jgi:hypothetical protein
MEDKLFAVIAEKDGYNKELVLLKLPFARFIDEVIVPYDSGDTFFIDGVPVKNTNLNRIKIVELAEHFQGQMNKFERGLTLSDDKTKKMYGDQYQTRFEHILRNYSTDVTAQVISAFNHAIKPSIKDYLPNRKELIDAATKIFVESIASLNG